MTISQICPVHVALIPKAWLRSILKNWQNSVQNKWLLNGSSIIPTVSCSSLVFKSSIPRTIETLTLSLFYPNNLLNLFLYEHFPEICSSPLCGCGANVQSSFHVAC